MDDSQPAPAPRKVRFAPKAPTRPSKPIEPKEEVKAEVDSSQTLDLLRRISESSGRGKPKSEKKSAPVQVAFGQGGQSSFIKSYGPLKNKAAKSGDGGDASVPGAEKTYVEPWNYYTYYPMTLPLRRPYSGNPVVLDEEEFGEDSANIDYEEEDYTNPAEELDLLDESGEEKMLFFQLPSSLPFVKQSAPAEAARRPKGCRLEDLPSGAMGKLLVYKSGAVKLKLDDTLYDVTAGSDCIFAQDVLAVNTEEKHCCVIGELNKRAIVTPDVDSVLKGVADLK